MNHVCICRGRCCTTINGADRGPNLSAEPPWSLSTAPVSIPFLSLVHFQSDAESYTHLILSLFFSGLQSSSQLSALPGVVQIQVVASHCISRRGADISSVLRRRQTEISALYCDVRNVDSVWAQEATPTAILCIWSRFK